MPASLIFGASKLFLDVFDAETLASVDRLIAPDFLTGHCIIRYTNEALQVTLTLLLLIFSVAKDRFKQRTRAIKSSMVKKILKNIAKCYRVKHNVNLLRLL